MPRQRKKKTTMHDIERAAKRQEQKDAGALDGRFRQRVVPNKKSYTRKVKHRSATDS